MYKAQFCVYEVFTAFSSDSSFAVVIVVRELLDAIISPGDWS
jgi:hypothetical protein